jgi:CRISPR-associated endonuclease Cas1
MVHFAPSAFLLSNEHMNALWITRMSDYKHSPLALESAKRLIKVKIAQETALLRRYQRPVFKADFSQIQTVGDILLTEARAARYFWRHFSELLPEGSGFLGRQPGAADPVNKLLDVGYHHVTGIVRKFLDERDVPVALGLLHVARTSASAPLAYDLVELFRADTVDAEALRFFRLKKKPLRTADEEIAHFLAKLNERLTRLHYLKNFGQCHTYRYYMELQILKFVKAVDHGEVFAPLHLPARHDTRCLTSRKPVLS